MTIKRYSLVPQIGTGTGGHAGGFRPDLSAADSPFYVQICTLSGFCLIKQNIADGTPMRSLAKNITVCDLLPDHSNFDSVAMTSGQISTVQSWVASNFEASSASLTALLAAQGGALNRQQFIGWVLRTLLQSTLTDTEALTGFDFA